MESIIAGVQFAGESAAYRAARNELLVAEQELRRKVEAVAAQRRALPAGHKVAQDYVFQALDGAGQEYSISLGELFRQPDQPLVVYGLMFAEGAAPCPMCTAFLDSFDGAVRHAQERLNIVVVAKGPPQQLADYAEQRGWRYLNLVSSANSPFNRDYFAELEGAGQIPMFNVFKKSNDDIHHSYTSEMYFSDSEPEQHPRHVDMLFPLWNLFDLTPEGRPVDWFPSTSP